VKQKTTQGIILIALTLLLAAAVVGWVLTRDRAAAPSAKRPQAPNVGLVDLRPLQTAQQLAKLAVSGDEQEFARQALRVGDHAVDLAFASALRNAALHPAPLSAEARELSARVKQSKARVHDDEQEVARLTSLVGAAPESRKEALQQQLEVARAQLELDRDELDDAQQDFLRAGGDSQSAIERMKSEHETLHQTDAGAGHAVASARPAATISSPEETTAGTVLQQFLAWNSLTAKARKLHEAIGEAQATKATLTQSHEALEKEVQEEQSQVPPQAPGSADANNTSSGHTAKHAAKLSALRHLTEDQKSLPEFDKGIEDEQELASIYEKWAALVAARKTHFVHGLLFDACWILLIVTLAAAANPLIQTSFSKIAADRRRLHTLRAAIGFAVRGVAVVLILLVIFGPPNNLATILALAGAGLTVALKDFIVGFFGWFVLMGRNGIHPGDWVEIEGIGGEVVEVGLLHTVLLETGSWSDAGHPTGRKVTFVNSFAIEGHYFNFSTTGQWLWDEIQVLLPHDVDPYRVADSILTIVAEDTASNARLAEAEWLRVTPNYAAGSFTATPAMIVRPTNLGVNVVVRYITRAHERHETRSRLYRSIVELLHRKKIPESAAGNMAARPVAAKTRNSDT
jgi:small-conductance mechanosensitive channel